ncbi:MAG: hypothetical protein E7E68_12385, partial [Staphylococcus sp.]|nr:hypothetical protein [Staphylococcus sp.]
MRVSIPCHATPAEGAGGGKCGQLRLQEIRPRAAGPYCRCRITGCTKPVGWYPRRPERTCPAPPMMPLLGTGFHPHIRGGAATKNDR